MILKEIIKKKINGIKVEFDSECESCGKITPQKELDENSKFSGYDFKRICDVCADKIDA